MIGKLQRVPLREVWKHEALDFTKWLEENPDVLSEALGITLSNIEREKNAGDFNVDLVAEDDSGEPVIIENQLEKSDHDHLGKVLTYLAATEAKSAVWIVSDPRPEHVKAIAWLNDSSSADFYMLKVEAVKIENSLPAPLLTRIVGPSRESKSISSSKKERAERHILRNQFWGQLIEKLRAKGISMHSNLSPSDDTWLQTGAGKAGLNFVYRIRMTDANVELYIDKGKDSEKETSTIYQHFLDHKVEIEQAYGASLEWDRMEGNRHCKIIGQIEAGGLKEWDKWEKIQDEMIDAMQKLVNAIEPFIKKIK